MVQREYVRHFSSIPSATDQIAEYLRGNTKSNECDELFSKYKSCLNKALKERGIDTMIDDARKSNKESDAEYLRRS
jgi:TRIAP1/MDM35 family protein